MAALCDMVRQQARRSGYSM